MTIDLQSLLDEELQWSSALVLAGETIVGRYRVAAGPASWRFQMAMPKTKAELASQTRLVRGFMAWKSAEAYVVSFQRSAPDAMASVAVSRQQVLARARLISLKPRGVGAVQILPLSVIGTTITSFLPDAGTVPEPALRQALERTFGPSGRIALEQMS